MQKLELQHKRTELIAELGTKPSPVRLIEIQRQLSEVNAELKRMNTIDNANARAAAELKRAAGLAEQQANIARATGTNPLRSVGVSMAEAAASLPTQRPKDPNGPRAMTRGEFILKQANQLIGQLDKIKEPLPHTVEVLNALTAFVAQQRVHVRQYREHAQRQAVAPETETDQTDWNRTWETP